MASLTEAARKVLSGKTTKVIKESNDPAPDRDAKDMNPNRASLAPGSKYSEPAPTDLIPAVRAGVEATEGGIVDLGPALVTPDGESGPAKAGDKMKKTAPRMADKTTEGEKRGTAAQIAEDKKALIIKKAKEAADKKLKLKEEAEKAAAEATADNAVNEEDDVELSEEVTAFIEELTKQGLSEEEIAKAIEENFELVEEETVEDDGLAEQIAAEREIDMTEHVNALLEGETLSDEFKAKAKAIFEAAVKAKLAEEIKVLETAFADTLEEEIQNMHTGLADDVDNYLNYVVEQWIQDNQIAVESNLMTEITEDFLVGLKNLFAENYIDVPKDKVNVLEQLAGQVAELTTKLNEEIERNVALNKSINEQRKDKIITQFAEGLTTTQFDKLKTLAENVEYTDETQYSTKIKTLKESYFPAKTPKASGAPVDAEEKIADGRELVVEGSAPMAKYVRALGRMQTGKAQ